MTTEPSRASFRIGFVPGVTLSKWSRLWEERRADLPLDVVEVTGGATGDVLDVLRGDDRVDMVLARLPLALLPTLIVPLVLVTLALIFWRLARERPGRRAP